MSFKATLTIDGVLSDVQVLHIDYALSRDVDHTGRPSSIVRGGIINVTVEGTDEVKLFEWMVDQFTTKNGKVTFYKRDSNTKMKEIKFENSYIVAWAETFDRTGENPFIVNFSVTAEKISLGDSKHENPWPKS